MARRYAILDVFTEEALSGNPLAVVLDGEGLDTAQMQRITQEFNLSETTFISKPENPVASARVRIFTPGQELAFAGHPTVGTAIILGLERLGVTEGDREAMVVLEESVGLVRCGVMVSEDKPSRAKFNIPKLPMEVAGSLDKGAIAQALGLNTGDIGFENHIPVIYHAGGPTFAFIPVKDQAATTVAKIKREYWDQAFGKGGNAYVYCRETVTHNRDFHARCFAPDLGLGEDPATGSAAAAFAGVITRFDAPRDGTHTLEIEQGFAMGRPSVIGLDLVINGGALTQVRISGSAVIIARGELYI